MCKINHLKDEYSVVPKDYEYLNSDSFWEKNIVNELECGCYSVE